MTARTVYILRARPEYGKPYWVAFDEDGALYGADGESRDSLLARWRASRGTYTKIVRYRGLHRPSEAAMTISAHRRKK